VNDLDLLTREFVARGNQSVTVADLVRVLQATGQVVDQIAQHRVFIDALQERLLLVDALPLEAPFGALIRLRIGTVPQRATLYLGNGVGQPLSKLVPAAL
jgi:hypothetical protein